MARIAVIGSGAIGCFYGAQFIFAGHDVRLLLRRDAERIARDGLVVRQTPTSQVRETARGAVVIPPTSFRVCREPAETVRDGAPEWTFVALKATALGSAGPLLGPAVECGSTIVTMSNGLGIEDELLAFVAADRLVGMLCFVCVNRGADGSIDHLAHGRVAIAPAGRQPERTQGLALLLADAGVEYEVANCLREARWRKLAWNIPFNGLSAAAAPGGIDTATILADPALRTRAADLIREVVAIANADLASRGLGRPLDATVLVPELFQRTVAMGAYLTSTVLDLRAQRAIESDALFVRTQTRARELGIASPQLDRITAELLRIPSSLYK